MTPDSELYLYTNLFYALQYLWPIPRRIDAIVDQFARLCHLDGAPTNDYGQMLFLYGSLPSRLPNQIGSFCIAEAPINSALIEPRLKQLKKHGLVRRYGFNTNPYWGIGEFLDEMMPPLPKLEDIFSMSSS